MDFVGNHILSVSQFNREDVQRIFQVADDVRPYAMRKRITRVLEGAIASNMLHVTSHYRIAMMCNRMVKRACMQLCFSVQC